jgi:hypothetical protein
MQGCALSSLECPNIIPGSGVDGISSGMALLLVITFLFIVCKVFGLRSCCLFGSRDFLELKGYAAPLEERHVNVAASVAHPLQLSDDTPRRWLFLPKV